MQLGVDDHVTSAMNPILKKLLHKGQTPVLLLSSPPEFAEVAALLGPGVDVQPKGKYGFVLAFAPSAKDARKVAKIVAKALSDAKAVFWLAYPKGTSQKYKGADI